MAGRLPLPRPTALLPRYVSQPTKSNNFFTHHVSNHATLSPTPSGGKPSWTARLLTDPSLCCKKVREEAGELCETWEGGEGRERAASEMADLLYHSMVLLNVQVRAGRGGAEGRGYDFAWVSTVLGAYHGALGLPHCLGSPRCFGAYHVAWGLHGALGPTTLLGVLPRCLGSPRCFGAYHVVWGLRMHSTAWEAPTSADCLTV
jgi:phosphoribosyl-ATP pyrophosphohydrolase